MQKSYSSINIEPQIRLDELTYQILYSDYLYFNKRSINTLINEIIKQYSETFIANQKEKYLKFKTVLLSSRSNISDINDLASKLLTHELKHGNETLGKKVKPLKIHINYRYENYFLNLEQLLEKYNNNIGFGEMLRYLILQYTKQSRSERETILVQEQINDLKQAIKQNVQIKIRLNNNDSLVFDPYEIINPLDDEGNYLFGEINGSPEAIALHTIKHVVILNSQSSVSSSSLDLLKKLKNSKFDYQNLSNYASTNIIQKVIQLQKRSTNLK